MKKLLLKVIRSLPVGVVLQEQLLFYLKLGYWPNFRSPKSFNEKINHRKLFSTDEFMAKCADKIAVRDHVAGKVGEEYLIPLLYSGESITWEQLHALGDNIVAKPNHDSKSTEIIRVNAPEIAKAAAARLQAKVAVDFGKQTNQFVYSMIPPRILVEKMLVEKSKPTPDDYKIYCFRQSDGSTKMQIEVHENREQPDYKVVRFREDLQPIKMAVRRYQTAPFPCPEEWPRMRKIAEILSADFDYVRIDLYLVRGRIYFGEMTFFDGGGRTEFSTEGGARNDLDREMGKMWTLTGDVPRCAEELSSSRSLSTAVEPLSR